MKYCNIKNIYKGNLKRKLFFLGLILLTLFFLGYLYIFEPRNIKFERKKLPIKNLSQSWCGKKLVQVSDIHLSRYSSLPFIEKIFNRINREKPDLIIFTGDYISHEQKYIEPFRRLSKKLKTNMGNKGKIAIIGNHDFWTSQNKIVKILKEADFQVLVNKRLKVKTKDKSILYFLGSDDLWVGKPNLDILIKGINLDKDSTILLCHNPDIFPKAADRGISTVLAGHTHGGQVVLPFIGAPILPSVYRYRSGFYKINDSLMYVNRGIGVVTPPVRFFCPPEVTVFTLENR